ncbi:MAG: hypothetical protein JXB24_09380 [Bacteroidales bacterium]|nr:hypothetical protein [Bacteroidales bacterium]
MKTTESLNTGAKARNLKILENRKFPVPFFQVFSSDPIRKDRFYAHLDEKLKTIPLFAVRSSANIEDGKEKSFAGQFFSDIAEPYNKLFNAFLKVRKSYRNIPGGIIIQEFINSDKAGVIFSDNGSQNTVINANFGLCKTVVEGHACDEYIVSRNGSIVSTRIEEEKKPLRFSLHGLKQDNVYTGKQVLSKKEIKKLTRLAIKIEQIMGAPQDIEWCIKNGKVYILQTRPITRKLQTKFQTEVYDSANIAESYSGIVKPLTFTFARQIYKTVYFNLLRASGVSKRKLICHEDIFENMLRIFYGRMYYNMNNWYLMMAFIPGYNRNKRNLESMISSNITGEIKHEIAPDILLKISYPFIFLVKYLFMPLSMRWFKMNVEKKLCDYLRLHFKDLNWQECMTIYNNLSKNLLEKWHIPVENDFLVMTFWGILKKKMKDEELKDYIHFDNISARQVESIATISAIFNKVPELQRSIQKLDVQTFDSILADNASFNELLTVYFKHYGGRFANELKLESPDLEEDKLKLLQMLRLYKNYKRHKSERAKKRPRNLTMIYILNRFKKYAAQREEMRLLRSNCFSLVRKIFYRAGEILYDQNIIENVEDIFYFDIHDIIRAKDPENLIPVVSQINARKKDYANYNSIHPLPYFKLTNDEDIPLQKADNKSQAVLFGTPCTAGLCEGKVRVFYEYQLPEKIDFSILVTSHTDPGWTPLIGLSKGLIIEHGGILSHAAIVSRELGIPTVIGVHEATKILRTGMITRVNGNTGQIQIIQTNL